MVAFSATDDSGADADEPAVHVDGERVSTVGGLPALLSATADRGPDSDDDEERAAAGASPSSSSAAGPSDADSASYLHGGPTYGGLAPHDLVPPPRSPGGRALLGNALRGGRPAPPMSADAYSQANALLSGRARVVDEMDRV
jgi:hypothetical protein